MHGQVPRPRPLEDARGRSGRASAPPCAPGSPRWSCPSRTDRCRGTGSPRGLGLDVERRGRRDPCHPKHVLGARPAARSRACGRARRACRPRGRARGAGAPGRPRAGRARPGVRALGDLVLARLEARAVPRARARSTKPSGLRITPASSRRPAMSVRPWCGGMSTTRGRCTAGAAVKIQKAAGQDTARATSAPSEAARRPQLARGVRPNVLTNQGRSIMVFLHFGRTGESRSNRGSGSARPWPGRLSGILTASGRRAPDLPGGITCRSLHAPPVTNGSPRTADTASSPSSRSSRASRSPSATPTAACSCRRSTGPRRRGPRSRASCTSSRTCRASPRTPSTSS